MEKLYKSLKTAKAELQILKEDIEKIIVNKANKDSKDIKDNKEKKNVSLKSMQQVTTLYKNKQELDYAKENPEKAFITKKINEIFGKL